MPGFKKSVMTQSVVRISGHMGESRTPGAATEGTTVPLSGHRREPFLQRQTRGVVQQTAAGGSPSSHGRARVQFLSRPPEGSPSSSGSQRAQFDEWPAEGAVPLKAAREWSFSNGVINSVHLRLHFFQRKGEERRRDKLQQVNGGEQKTSRVRARHLQQEHRGAEEERLGAAA